MSASSFIVNLQWYLAHPPSLHPSLTPRTSHRLPPPSPLPVHMRISHPAPLNSTYRIEFGVWPEILPPSPPSLLPSSARPPIIALVIDWIIKVLITHPSSSGWRAAPPSAHPSLTLSLPRYHFHSACACAYVCVRVPYTPRQIICSDEAWIPTVITFRLIFN